MDDNIFNNNPNKINNNNPNKINNQSKKIDYKKYAFYLIIGLNIILIYSLMSKPSLDKELINLYNNNQESYKKIQNYKKILDGNFKK